MADGFEFELKMEVPEILKLLGEALPVAFREGASLIALTAQTLVLPHTITGETIHGIVAGMKGRKALVQTEWPGIAIDRPHRTNPGGKTRTRGKGAEIKGLWYIEEAFETRAGDVVRILQDKTDSAARKQMYRLPSFTKGAVGE